MNFAILVKEGAGLSTVAIAGQDDVTTFTELHIENHGRPTSLLVETESSVIFRLTGAIKNLSTVIVLNGDAGFVGIDDKIVLQADRGCSLSSWRTLTRGRTSVKDTIAESLGVELDSFLVTGTNGLTILPSGSMYGPESFYGSFEYDKTSVAAAIWDRVAQYYPLGIFEFLSSEVVGVVDAVPYEVLPREAGLARLVEQGEITIVDDGSTGLTLQNFADGSVEFLGLRASGVEAFTHDDVTYRRELDGVWRGRRKMKFRVHDEFNLPAGLSVRHAAEFLVPTDVPDPNGKLHSDSSIVSVPVSPKN